MFPLFSVSEKLSHNNCDNILFDLFCVTLLTNFVFNKLRIVSTCHLSNKSNPAKNQSSLSL